MKPNLKQINRYDRQILLKEIGLSGQEKLLNSKVLIIGAGGLGCPASIYLALSGVGNIGIADPDSVALNNLQRQILFREDDVGKNKALCAKKRLESINGEINIKAYPLLIKPENVEEIIDDYDFIIDASDNFETKFLINDACVIQKKPFCHAGVIQFHGQVKTYVPGKGPCIRCLFEEVPEKGTISKCADVGVFGSVCGIIGCIQSAEAIKYITGTGNLLIHSMYIFDVLSMKSRSVVLPDCSKRCRVCGPMADIKNIINNADEYSY